MVDRALEYDSSMDYRWRVAAIRPGARKLVIEYRHLDSADSDYPILHRTIQLSPGEVNDSDVAIQVQSQSMSVVREWNARKAFLSNINEDLTQVLNLKGRAFHKKTIIDSAQKPDNQNPFRFKVDPTITETATERRLSYTLTELSDSDKDLVRQGLTVGYSQIWERLLFDGKVDSAVSYFGLDSLGEMSANEISMLTGMSADWGDSVIDDLKTLYNYSDSEIALWMYNIEERP